MPRSRTWAVPLLTDRDNLWRLLVLITARKVAHLIRDEQRQKRGGQSRSRGVGRDSPELEEIIGCEPTAEFIVQVVEECQRLMALLPRGDLKQVALRKLEGFTNQEIARELACASRSVDRKLQLIRVLWDQESEP